VCVCVCVHAASVLSPPPVPRPQPKPTPTPPPTLTGQTLYSVGPWCMLLQADGAHKTYAEHNADVRW
jgi:hypothetical protein